MLDDLFETGFGHIGQGAMCVDYLVFAQHVADSDVEMHRVFKTVQYQAGLLNTAARFGE